MKLNGFRLWLVVVSLTLGTIVLVLLVAHAK